MPVGRHRDGGYGRGRKRSRPDGVLRSSPRISLIENRNSRGESADNRIPSLAADTDDGGISFVAFVLDGFLCGGTESFFVGVLGQIAVATDYFFSIHDANQPLGFVGVPGNFHLVRI